MIQRTLLLILAAALLTVLFFWLRPEPAAPGDTPAASAVQRFDYRIDAQGRVDGPEVARLRQGEHVSLHVTTARDDEVHLHGYNIARKIAGGQTAVLRFHADTAGRFTLELHAAHQRIGVLEVAPR